MTPEETRSPSGPVLPPATAIHVCLFTDLVSSTAWKKALLDRAYTTDVRIPHDQLFRQLLADYPGAVERDNAGDGFLATFATPSDAVAFALRFHQVLAAFDWSAAVRRTGMPVTRVGIHLGEVVEFADPAGRKVSGQAVDLAARVMSLGLGGQTLLTRHAFDSARQHLARHPGDDFALAWVAHGGYRFKGNEDDPLEVFGVGVEGSPALAAPADSEKARRVVVDQADDTGSWRPSLGQPIPRRDGWVLEQPIGEGGFGEVWLARHRKTKERRVFKFCFDADRLRSFKRELTLFKLLQSEFGDRPEFVRLYEVRVDQPPYMLESEYIVGGNLAEWVAKTGFDHWPPADRLRFLRQVARTVAGAHSLGIIHKDLKPSNILIREAQGTPQPVVADFGIGVLTDRSILDQRQITATGGQNTILQNDSSRTGTRLYSPPESLLGKPATTGHDVYALGVLLYQLLAGSFEEPLGTGWEDRLSGESTRTNLLKEDIRDATRTDLAKRLPSAMALADRLERLPEREQDQARKARAIQQSRRVKALQRTLAMTAALLVLVGGAAVYAWHQREAAETARQAESQRVTERDTALSQKNEALLNESAALAATRAREAELKYHLGNSNMLLANEAYDNHQIDVSRAYLDKVPVEQRNFEWHYRQKSCRQEKIVMFGHTDGVTRLTYSLDGKRLASAGRDKAIYIWDSRTGKRIDKYVWDMKPYRGMALAFSPSGSRVATWSDDVVQTRDTFTGRVLNEFKIPYLVSGLAFGPDGTTLSVAGDKGTLWVYDLDGGGPPVAFRTHGARITKVEYNPDGDLIVIGSGDDRVKIWNLHTACIQFEFKSSTKATHPIAFSPDGTRLATASDDNTIRIWDVKTGKQIVELRGHANMVTCVTFSPDGTQLASGCWDRSIRLWDARTGQVLDEYKGHIRQVYVVKFSPDGERLASVSDDGTVRLCDKKPKESALVSGRRHDAVMCAIFSPDGTRVASGNASRVGSGRADAPVRIWDSRTGRLTHELNGHANVVFGVSFSSDGRRLASAGSGKTVQIWDVQSGQLLHDCKGHLDSALSVVFSPDGTRLASGSIDKQVRIWDTETGKTLHVLEGHNRGVNSLTYSPDGKRLISASADSLRIWDAASGTLAKQIVGPSTGINTMNSNSDGSRLSVGYANGSIAVWDPISGELIRTLIGHTDGIRSAAFSPDGTRLASASYDYTVRIWDLRTGQSLLELRHNNWATSVSFSPDGRRLISGCEDGKIHVWDTDIDQAEMSPFQEMADRLDRTAPNVKRVEDAYQAIDAQADPFAKRFHLDRLLSFPQNFGNHTLLRERNRLADNPRPAARATGHTPGMGDDGVDLPLLQMSAVCGDSLAQRLVAQQRIRDGKPAFAIPVLHVCMITRSRNTPPVEELLIAKAYLALNDRPQAERYYRAAADWLDRPRTPMRVADVVTKSAVNGWAALGDALKPVDDPRHNPFDWESWYECDVFRAEVEGSLAKTAGGK